MAKSFALIQTQTLAGTAASVTFSNIPQNYTDLRLVASARSSAGGVGNNMIVSFNGSSTGFTYKLLEGDGSSAASYSGSTGYNALAGGNSSTASSFGNAEIYIPNYTSGTNKSFSSDSVAENNGSTGVIDLFASLWSNTSTISSITLTPASGNFVTNSTFYLYGIGGNRATGGTVTSDGTYTYHTFTSTGTFQPLEQIKGAEILCIAGGGGGGKDNYSAARRAGGGGAGGYRYLPGQSFTAGNTYTALVGSGGTGAASLNGTSGTDSVFSTLVSTGGGYGAGTRSSDGGAGAGGAGGSGGGGDSDTASSPATNPAQGSAGGANWYDGVSTFGGGGGGGAGGAGGSVSPGNGGIGSSSSSVWGYATSTGQLVGGVYYYAGGGGGGGGAAGSGGLGGGGAGATASTATSGTANTGGGGGGARGGSGGAGGSGLIIVRYPSS